MTPGVVVDVGNSRIKWGLCRPTVADGGWVSLPPDDSAAWAEQAAGWAVRPGATWAVAGVAPARVDAMARWIEAGGGKAVVFRRNGALPITLDVDDPEAVGIDRVLGAIAAASLVPPGTPAITVDVGTAVTVNLVDAGGVFRGGAIFPGPRLMATALHDHTAKLPSIELDEPAPNPDRPGKNTADAIRTGIDAAVFGGVMSLVSLYAAECPSPPHLFVTGGGHSFVSGVRADWLPPVRTVPYLNLEGIRLAAESLT